MLDLPKDGKRDSRSAQEHHASRPSQKLQDPPAPAMLIVCYPAACNGKVTALIKWLEWPVPPQCHAVLIPGLELPDKMPIGSSPLISKSITLNR